MMNTFLDNIRYISIELNGRETRARFVVVSLDPD
jgi:hypothetical protein